MGNNLLRLIKNLLISNEVDFETNYNGSVKAYVLEIRLQCVVSNYISIVLKSVREYFSDFSGECETLEFFFYFPTDPPPDVRVRIKF